MRTVLLATAMLAGAACVAVMPVEAAPQPMPGLATAKAQVTELKQVGWRKRYYRRYGYPGYAYYPPAYGYYYPPPPAYYVPAYPAYPYYAPYRYYRPYYSPYY